MARYAGRLVGEFMELAGFVHGEDEEFLLVSQLVHPDAVDHNDTAELLPKAEGWQRLTTAEVFAFGDDGLQD